MSGARSRLEADTYPDDWPEIAQEAKDAAGWHCIRCGHRHEVDTGYVLTVHHIDMVKANCRWWNLVALCQRCHLNTRHPGSFYDGTVAGGSIGSATNRAVESACKNCHQNVHGGNAPSGPYLGR